jgi:hypothetical protein
MSKKNNTINQNGGNWKEVLKRQMRFVVLNNNLKALNPKKIKEYFPQGIFENEDIKQIITEIEEDIPNLPKNKIINTKSYNEKELKFIIKGREEQSQSGGKKIKSLKEYINYYEKDFKNLSKINEKLNEIYNKIFNSLNITVNNQPTETIQSQQKNTFYDNFINDLENNVVKILYILFVYYTDKKVIITKNNYKDIKFEGLAKVNNINFSDAVNNFRLNDGNIPEEFNIYNIIFNLFQQIYKLIKLFVNHNKSKEYHFDLIDNKKNNGFGFEPPSVQNINQKQPQLQSQQQQQLQQQPQPQPQSQPQSQQQQQQQLLQPVNEFKNEANYFYNSDNIELQKDIVLKSIEKLRTINNTDSSVAGGGNNNNKVKNLNLPSQRPAFLKIISFYDEILSKLKSKLKLKDQTSNLPRCNIPEMNYKSFIECIKNYYILILKILLKHYGIVLTSQKNKNLVFLTFSLKTKDNETVNINIGDTNYNYIVLFEKLLELENIDNESTSSKKKYSQYKIENPEINTTKKQTNFNPLILQLNTVFGKIHSTYKDVFTDYLESLLKVLNNYILLFTTDSDYTPINATHGKQLRKLFKPPPLPEFGAENPNVVPPPPPGFGAENSTSNVVPPPPPGFGAKNSTSNVVPPPPPGFGAKNSTSNVVPTTTGSNNGYYTDGSVVGGGSRKVRKYNKTSRKTKKYFKQSKTMKNKTMKRKLMKNKQTQKRKVKNMKTRTHSKRK